MHKPILAIMGTDGAGKTTLLNAALPEIESRLGKKFVVRHLKPDFLPPLGQLRGVKHETGYVCRDPHGSIPSGFVGSLLRITYLTIDYVFGYWFKVRKTIRQEEVAGWIFDRYAYDLLFDPRRFRIQLPGWIIRIYLAVIPKPDRIVCLGGDPAVIFARKPETSLECVTRQVEQLRAYAVADSHAVWIDTTQPLELCVQMFREALS